VRVVRSRAEPLDTAAWGAVARPRSTITDPVGAR
jgi:hypothetical protein